MSDDVDSDDGEMKRRMQMTGWMAEFTSTRSDRRLDVLYPSYPPVFD
jgi:hypothetical protein